MWRGIVVWLVYWYVGVVWCGWCSGMSVVWRGVAWYCGVAGVLVCLWRGVAWCGVVWYCGGVDVVVCLWRGVVWCGAGVVVCLWWCWCGSVTVRQGREVVDRRTVDCDLPVGTGALRHHRPLNCCTESRHRRPATPTTTTSGPITPAADTRTPPPPPPRMYLSHLHTWGTLQIQDQSPQLRPVA